MAWNAKPLKHLLEIAYISRNGRDFSYSEDCIRDEFGYVNLSLKLSPENTEARVRPYTLEYLENVIEEEHHDWIINKLFVGIRDEAKIAYLGNWWTSKQSKHERVEQYFFREDQPSAFNLGSASGPRWPLNRPPLEHKLLQYFNTLKEVKPATASSLDKCLEHLAKPGPEYRS